jgi:hypothetical protein
VVLQVTLSFILLVGATLLMHSLSKLRTTDPGFSTTRVLDTWMPLVAASYDVPRAKAFQDELIQRVRALPGVEAAAYARVVPLGYESYSSTPMAVDGYEPQPNEQPTAEYDEVSPDYFRHSSHVRARIHSRGRRKHATRRHRKPNHGRAVLARAGSHRSASAGERQLGASGRRRQRFEILQHG